METNTQKANIYQKLLVIQKSVIGLGKDRNTKSQYNPGGYSYVTGSKVLENIKPLMNELGLILKQEVISAENIRQDYTTQKGTKSEILTKVMMKFTWVDCETGEKDENLFGANGQNDWEKGFGSALTYAERYFLLKYFHIATDEDDIDNPDRVKSEPVKSPTEIPAPIPNTSIPVQDSVENKEASEIEAHLKKVLVDDKNLMIKQKDFRSTPEGAHFQSCASIPDVVKFNDIELVRSFYRFIKKK
jgi:hypothetical protein